MSKVQPVQQIDKVQKYKSGLVKKIKNVKKKVSYIFNKPKSNENQDTA